jgi:hypothetical protein
MAGHREPNANREAEVFLEILTGEADPVMDIRTIAESADAREKVAAWRSVPQAKRPSLRFNYRGRFSMLLPALKKKNAAGWAVFYSANRTDGAGRSLKNMVGARMLALDLDGAPLPAKWKIAPHAIIETSSKRFQCIWVLNETQDFAGHRDVMLRLAMRYGGDKSIADITRVLRMPGFLHQKRKPFLSRVVQHKGPDYVSFDRRDLSDFDWLPKLKVAERRHIKANGGTVTCKSASEYFHNLPITEFGKGNYDDWLRIGMAMHHATGGEAKEEWLAWCAGDPEYDDDDSQDEAGFKWDSFSLEREGAVTVGTLDWYGKKHGVPERILDKIKFSAPFEDDLELADELE